MRLIVQSFDCEVLFRPHRDELAFLPEGPFPCGDGQISWVAIQHGKDATAGSLNVLDLATRENVTHELPGRPGFAFTTNRRDTFVIGAERRVGLSDLQTGTWTDLIDGIDSAVDGTIINDGVVFPGGLIFGCKDLQFKDAKAGLYLWRNSDRRLIQLRSNQVCSNGKVIVGEGSHVKLLDIDSPTKTVVEYSLDVEAGTLSDPRVVVDFRDGDVFPDGMVLTPDERHVIVAIYNPHDAPFGEARQYHLGSGELVAIWRTELSPQVTCPLLVQHDDGVKLVLTTAVEHMSREKRQRYPNAGCLFIADTPFDSLPEQPVFQL